MRWLSAGMFAGLVGCSALPVATAPAARLPGFGPAAVVRPGVSLRGLAAVDGSTVWVAGSAGTVARSVDGGATWQLVPPPVGPRVDFRAVVARDAHTAVVMVAGEPAELWRTTDAGGSWRRVLQDPRPGAFFDALAADGDRLYLLGDPQGGRFVLFTSADGGASWQELAGPAALPGEAAFAASSSCLVARSGVVFVATGGSHSRLLRSDDGGRSWTAAVLPLAQGAPSQGTFGLAVRGERLLAVGGDYLQMAATAGTAAGSDDGGRTWWRPPAAAALGYRSAVAWLAGGAALAVGPDGVVWSAAGGHAWQPVPGPGFHALGVARDGTVYACGHGGRVARLGQATVD